MPGVLKTQRESSIQSHRVFRYIAYAAGEIFLIFVGISLAIAFENSNEQRRTRALELEILGSIRQNLEANLEELDRNISDDSEAVQLLDPILAHLRDERPWNGSLEEPLGRAIEWSSPYFATSGYENLKQLGLHIVSDSGTREQLVHLFENTYTRLIGDFDGSQWEFFGSVMLPIRNRELDRIDPSGDRIRALRIRDYEGALRRGDLLAMLSEHQYAMVIGLRARQQARDETEAMLGALQRYMSVE